MTSARDFLKAFDKAVEAGLIQVAPTKAKPGKFHRRNVTLDDVSVARALKIGDGQVSVGIRRALERAAK